MDKTMLKMLDNIQIKGLEYPLHYDLPIRCINLCVMMDPQVHGLCDERSDLSVTIKQYRKQPPRPANHFALWFGYEGKFNIAIDITQKDENPNPNTKVAASIIRVALKTIPCEDDMGCIHREFQVKPNITIRDVITMIVQERLNQYQFQRVERQFAGCRQWILDIAGVLEIYGFAGKGFGEKVHSCLTTYYRRQVIKSGSGVYKPGANWGECSTNKAANIVPGTYTWQSEGNLA